MGTKLLACLCTIDNQGTYTSTLCLYPKSREPVYFSLVSLSGAVCVEHVYSVVAVAVVAVLCVFVFFSCSLPLFRPSHSMSQW